MINFLAGFAIFALMTWLTFKFAIPWICSASRGAATLVIGFFALVMAYFVVIVFVVAPLLTAN